MKNCVDEKVQLLISAVNVDAKELIKRMNVSSDAILINQCDTNDFETLCIKDEKNREREIKVYSFWERGVGLSRNNALLRADKTISLFADDDIIYEKDYEQKILKEFECHKEADVLLFNVQVSKERRTYFHTDYHRVRWYNCGRYPAYAIAIRTEEMHRNNLTFSLYFGGGARYSNGEDSLFLRDCLKAGLKLYATDVCIGREEAGESTWFFGYTQKFFYDRGVLYYYLYGKMGRLWGLRFLLKNKNEMCREIPFKKAFAYFKEGYKSAGLKRHS